MPSIEVLVQGCGPSERLDLKLRRLDDVEHFARRLERLLDVGQSGHAIMDALESDGVRIGALNAVTLLCFYLEHQNAILTGANARLFAFAVLRLLPITDPEEGAVILFSRALRRLGDLSQTWLFHGEMVEAVRLNHGIPYQVATEETSASEFAESVFADVAAANQRLSNLYRFSTSSVAIQKAKLVEYLDAEPSVYYRFQASCLFEA